MDENTNQLFREGDKAVLVNAPPGYKGVKVKCLSEPMMMVQIRYGFDGDGEGDWVNVERLRHPTKEEIESYVKNKYPYIPPQPLDIESDPW